MTKDTRMYQAKLLARVHDPAEKALVLLRDPAGHEGGTVSALRNKLFPDGVQPELEDLVRRADRWAAAADRPQFPRDRDNGPYEAWAQVHFAKDPVIYHPLSGAEADLLSLQDVQVDQLKAVSLDHYEGLLVRDEQGGIDYRKTALSFWRFAPRTPAKGLGALWELLPADTRVPDHSIWAHLDLVSAFSGAFSVDPENVPALLIVSLGPVQGFIAQARSTSDLWAGSHLLSFLSWEAMKVICEDLGPDAIIFPQLRGVPLVDVWLHKEIGLPFVDISACKWRETKSDANPLFTAALPNKLVAIVPSCRTCELAEAIETRTRKWVKEKMTESLRLLLDVAGEENRQDLPCHEQVAEQLADFPEVHWAAVPWSLIEEDPKGLVKGTRGLVEAMKVFYPEGQDHPGFLGSSFWNVLQGCTPGGMSFFKPNPGVLYPAVYDLADRLLSSAKTFRPFYQLRQEGFRCSLCGEREWLTTDREALMLSPGNRTATLWAKVGQRRPAWTRKGEHLCALCALKRLWPSVFVREGSEDLGFQINRFVVSTHTMALATTFERWLQGLNGKAPEGEMKEHFIRITSQFHDQTHDPVALPRSLHRQLQSCPEDVRRFVHRLPSFLDDLKEKARQADEDAMGKGERDLQKVEALLEKVFGRKPEAYYALILMDGDDMGAWVSGTDPRLALLNKELWHPQVRAYVENSSKDGALERYLGEPRAASPARHTAISAALNAFSLELSGYVVEDIFKGKVLYSGGDDLLAMVSIDDLLPAMLFLRKVYSGTGIGEGATRGSGQAGALSSPGGIRAKKGYVLLQKRLLRVMGQKASASMGAVIAHHMAPLGRVLREMRIAEKRAKSVAGKDAFSLTLMKRSGGMSYLTLPWLLDDGEQKVPKTTPMDVLISLRDAFADKDMSRRAAYLIQDWAARLPGPEMVGGRGPFMEMLAKNVEYQLRRQCKGSSRYAQLGSQLADVAMLGKDRIQKRDDTVLDEKDVVCDVLTVAEFLAREGRIESRVKQDREKEND